MSGRRRLSYIASPAARALQASEARYRLLHESMRDCFAQVNLSGEIVDVNPAFLDMLGYSKEDLESKLHAAGFDIYKFTYTYGRWGNIAWRLGIKYPMLMLNVSKIFF